MCVCACVLECGVRVACYLSLLSVALSFGLLINCSTKKGQYTFCIIAMLLVECPPNLSTDDVQDIYVAHMKWGEVFCQGFTDNIKESALVTLSEWFRDRATARHNSGHAGGFIILAADCLFDNPFTKISS